MAMNHCTDGSKAIAPPPIHIVFAADTNYAMPLGVAICSVARHCRARQIVFNVLYDKFDAALQQRVQASLDKAGHRNAAINWIRASTEVLAGLKITHRYLTPMIYARLLIPQVLGAEVSRVLYLDCDILALDDVGRLWEMDLDSQVIGAVPDHIGSVSSPCGLANYRELGMSPTAKYFNSGVLLIDLKRWREERISERALEHIRTYRDILRMEDQEALNAVLYGAWKELPADWNWQIEHRRQRRTPRKSDSRPERGRISILHFTTEEKPWHPGCSYEEKGLFFEYLDHTEWAGWRIPFHKELSARISRRVQDFKDVCGLAKGNLCRKLRCSPCDVR